MKVLGCLGFYSCYIKNLLVDSQPFHDLKNDSTPFHWTEERETLFNSIKKRIHKKTVLAVPSTYYPFHIRMDSSNVGRGCIFIQQFHEGKRNISCNSRVFDKGEQKNVYSSSRTIWNRNSSPDIRTLHNWITISYLPIL